MSDLETALNQAGSDAQAMREAMEAYYKPLLHDEGLFISVPNGIQIKSIKPFLDEYRDRPERREGTAKLSDLDSLIAWTKRHQGDHSALFAFDSETEPSLTAVIDYHEAGAETLDEEGTKARFGRHRATYPFPLSKEWLLWHKHDKKAMSQDEFALFLEEQIIDVMDPPAGFRADSGESPSEQAAGGDFGETTADERLAELLRRIGGRCATVQSLITLSRDLAVYARENVRDAVNLSSGEKQIKFTTEHCDASGEPLLVPNVFLIAIPVFHNGPRYRIAARLRYRISGGQLAWAYELLRARDAFDHAFGEGCAKAQSETELPLFKGVPEDKS